MKWYLPMYICSPYDATKEEGTGKDIKVSGKKQLDKLTERSDEAPETNSANPKCHVCWSSDCQVGTSKSPTGCVERNKVRVFCILHMGNLGTASIVLADNGAGWPQLVSFQLKLELLTLSSCPQNLCMQHIPNWNQIGRFCDKAQVSQHPNYISVVFQAPHCLTQTLTDGNTLCTLMRFCFVGYHHVKIVQ